MLQKQVTTTEAVTSHAIVNKGEKDLRSGSLNHPQTHWLRWAEDERAGLVGSFQPEGPNFPGYVMPCRGVFQVR